MDRVPTRRQYIEQLVDAALHDAQEMSTGFMAWCEQHAPLWHEQGYDETWIRLRIDSARSSYKLHQTLLSRHMTPGQQRKVMREMYDMQLPGMPDMYDLMLKRTGQTAPDATIRGNTDDLLQRYTLRVLVHEADKASWEAYCRWSGQGDTPYKENPDLTMIRDLSTVEELEYALGMCYCLCACFTADPPLDFAAINLRIDQWAKQARADFIARHGYLPETATTPFTPVTINGPVDHDDYMAMLRQNALDEEPD